MRANGYVCGTLLLVTLFGGSGCGSRKVVLTTAGSTSFMPVAERLAAAFSTVNPGTRLAMQDGESAVGVQAVLEGAADIGVADFAALPEPANRLNRVVVARDAVAIVVHPTNPISGLSREQVRDIFGGTTTVWQRATAADHPITVVCREAGSGTRASFEDGIPGGGGVTRNAIVVDSSAAMHEAVANDLYAIGYVSMAHLDSRVKALQIDGQPCSGEGVGTGRYPLVRPIHFLTRENPHGTVQEFINFVLSPAGQRIIRDGGLVPAA